jgi:formate/nitrite transporter
MTPVEPPPPGLRSGDPALDGAGPNVGVDPLLPQSMARAAELAGVRKASAPALTTFVLAVLAGAFIALGAMFATTVAAGTAGVWPFGPVRLLMGLVFSLGLVLVVVGGAELFTGNNLIVMAWASRKVSAGKLLRNWLIVYAGNLTGAAATAVLVFVSGVHTSGGGEVGSVALKIAAAKVGLGFTQAVALGVLCNALVCLAVWMTYSARSTTDKIAAVILPVSAFVAAGFEHSVANMYYLPYGLLIKDMDPAFAAVAGPDLQGLTWASFLLRNLLPVSLGNILGGGVLVAAVYWFIYLRAASGAPPEPPRGRRQITGD